jgi:hypothetical protein
MTTRSVDPIIDVYLNITRLCQLFFPSLTLRIYVPAARLGSDTDIVPSAWKNVSIFCRLPATLNNAICGRVF